MKVTYIVTAAYADVIDEPQVYETEVEASSVEEAESAAQAQARKDNGHAGSDDLLTSVYARVKPLARPDVVWAVPNADGELALYWDEQDARIYREEMYGIPRENDDDDDLLQSLYVR